MSAQLINKDNRNLTTVGKLKDGQIAIMVDNSYVGLVVQRYGDNCVAIGKSSLYGWSSCNNNILTVRILEDGELIEIFDNK
jgi:hypothetical protein